ncbi:enoyl-CoA hydratase/isomerase family protein [Sphingobacterium sp. LRF_L2]|uniref:enoyl-CoA hydratase/isomerase family protein n=1 Tax=Sphingobacterium sp. LRF_L2 TaxID=3369421 RepID=UPI003F5F1479
MQYNYIRTQKNGSIFTLTLARPDKRNAFTPTMISEISHALGIAEEESDVKLVVLRAEGKIFCAGMDLKTFEDPSSDKLNPELINTDVSLGAVMYSFCKPSIAIVEGDVIAGGFLLILGCTYVLSAANVRFRLPELELGIFPFQVMASLLKVMPEKKVLQLCLETSYFGFDEALAYGIVDDLFTEEKLNRLIDSFSDKKVTALKAGIYALRKLGTINSNDQFHFLKKQLESLRENSQ